MFHISEKYSGKDKHNTIGYYKGREKERQDLRKKLHPVTRDLDNYFYSKYHDRVWLPNGLFRRKKFYYYAEPGLGFFYEKNNVTELKDLRELESENKKYKLKTFIEYSYIEDNQYIITIEYCSNCEEHKTHTFHNADLYRNYAINMQKCILLRFPFIKVVLKPIDTNIMKEERLKLPKVDSKGNYQKKIFVNDKFKDVRIGAFEVQICNKKNGEDLKISLLHSKLKTKQFPKISTILDKIVGFLPKFSGKIITYEKEEDTFEDLKRNNHDEFNNNELLKGLQVNIYLLNNSTITNITNNAWNDILNHQDPHKRTIMLNEQRIKMKESMFKNDFTIKSYGNRSRPITSITGYREYHKSHSMINFIRPNTSKTFLLGNNDKNLNININESSILSSSIAYKSRDDYILDKNISKSLKGKLIISKYTNKDGSIDIGPLPFDSYYIEVQESKQYRSTGLKLTFDTLNLKNKNNIKKYIGLFTQQNSFFELHIYEMKKNENGIEEPTHLENANVTLKQISKLNMGDNDENNLENSQNDENFEKKIKIEENSNSPGIFEHTVPPGRYLLEVEKENYETIRKLIDLKKGENNINIEMTNERYCNLHIVVYNYEKFQEELYEPIKNVDITIYKNANEILEESITNNKGEFNYIVNKGEDLLTIYISKLGYYPVQRLFLRNKNAKINEKDEYEEKLVFFLVKERFIIENNCILCVTYCSLSKINFNPDSIQISDKIKNRLNLLCFDGQKESGIISTFIKYKTKQEINQKNKLNNSKGKGSLMEEKEEEGEELQNNKNININENIDENLSSNSDEIDESENYDNIISLSLIIKNKSLKNNNYEDKGFAMNGLERYGCQTIIYTPKNIFYITAPSVYNEGYYLWNIGWLDVKNNLFYQTNTLTNSSIDRTLYFSGWLEFLQALIDNKIYLNIFQFFGFEKSILLNNDRYINESLFIQCLQKLNFCKNNKEEIIPFIISLFKSKNKMISFSLVKKIISSNLKNFSEENYNEKKNKNYEIAYNKKLNSYDNNTDYS